MRLLSIAALAAVAILSAGCSGCSTVEKAISNDHAVLEGQKIDEQAMGAVDALGITANTLIKAAADLRDPATGLPVATRAQLLQLQSIRKDLDAAHDAAKAAYDIGDAKTFRERLQALTTLSNRAAALYREVTK